MVLIEPKEFCMLILLEFCVLFFDLLNMTNALLKTLGPPLTNTLAVYTHLDDYLQKRMGRWKSKLEKKLQNNFNKAVDDRALELVQRLIREKDQGGPSGHGGDGPSGHGGDGPSGSLVD